MIEAKPKVNQLQRYTYYPKVSDVCKKWEDISNRIQVRINIYIINLNIIHCLFSHCLYCFFFILTFGICNACAL